MTATDKRILLAIVSLCLASTAIGRTGPKVRWGHQLVTPTRDHICGAMVADSNDGIYMVVTRESEDNSGSKAKAVFLLKYSRQGDQLWSRQLDAGVEGTSGLTADDQGNIYVFGHATSTPERKTKGGFDACIAKYDHTGTRLWSRQLGTPRHDVCSGLAVGDSGVLYISGYTYGSFAKPNKGGADMFIAAYSQSGTLMWKDQLGTSEDDRALDIRIGDNNDIYLCGNTDGSLARESFGQRDLVVARYDRTGKSVWLNQYGTTGDDSIMCMEVGELGLLYLGSRTNGNVGSRQPQRRDLDSCLIGMTDTGKMLWVRQFGTHGWDGTWDMARFMDGSGDILISGCQIPIKSKCQAYCRRYSSQGELIWTQEFREFNSRGGTCGRAVAIDSDNNCYHAGQTNADLFGLNNGTPNVYIVRFDEARDEQASP